MSRVIDRLTDDGLIQGNNIVIPITDKILEEIEDAVEIADDDEEVTFKTTVVINPVKVKS